MSHTDKTRPTWVQFRDPENHRFMEEPHHHEDGVCDFDEWLANPGRRVRASQYRS